MKVGFTALVGLCAIMPKTVHAQPSGAEFSVLHFMPTVNAEHYFITESAALLPHLSPSFGLSLSYAHRPLELYLPHENTSATKIIRHQMIADLVFGIGLWNRFEFGLALPIMLIQGSEDFVSLRGRDDAALGSGLGDVRFLSKARILSVGTATIAFSLPVSFPTGDSKNFLGDGGFVVSPSAVMSVSFGKLSASLNLTYRIREGRAFDVGTSQHVVIDDELLLAAGLRFRLFEGMLDLVADGRIAIGIEEQDSEEIFAEVLGGVRYYVPHTNFFLNIGGGPGIGRGLGTPAVRLFAHLAWNYASSYSTGSRGSESQLGLALSQRGGHKYERGERELDRDRDGLKNSIDHRSHQTENSDKVADADGSSGLDSDGDGILDKVDKCPNEPEGALDGFQDEDGCPDPDNDGDGLLDVEEKCPVLAEIVNGFRDEDGCPDKVLESQVKLDRVGIRIPRIQFYSMGTNLNEQAQTLLDKLAELIAKNTWVNKIRIEGHTDDQNSYQYNISLSRRRAQAVINYLVQKGLPRSRFVLRGYGEGLPIANNRTEVGRRANRRVVFVLVDPVAQSP